MDINRNWTFLILGQWLSSNFRANRLYTSKSTEQYKWDWASEGQKESVSLLIVIRCSKTPGAETASGKKSRFP